MDVGPLILSVVQLIVFMVGSLLISWLDTSTTSLLLLLPIFGSFLLISDLISLVQIGTTGVNLVLEIISKHLEVVFDRFDIPFYVAPMAVYLVYIVLNTLMYGYLFLE